MRWQKLICWIMVAVFTTQPYYAQARVDTTIAEIAPVTAELPDSQVAERLDYVTQELQKNTWYSRFWWDTWMTVFTVGALGHGAWALAINEPGHDSKTGYLMSERQIDLSVGLVTTLLGVGSMLIFPYPQRFAYGRVQILPEDTQQEKIQKLIQAEDYLRTSADADVRGKAWFQYILSGTVTVTTGLVLGVGFDLWAMGIQRAALGTVVGTTKIISQSRASLYSWQNYVARFSLGKSDHGVPVTFDGLEMTPPPTEVSWNFVPVPNGLGLGVNF